MHRLEAGMVKCLDHLFAPNHNDTVTVADFNNNCARILIHSVLMYKQLILDSNMMLENGGRFHLPKLDLVCMKITLMFFLEIVI